MQQAARPPVGACVTGCQQQLDNRERNRAARSPRRCEMNAVKSQQRDRRVAEAVAVLEARLTAADADPIVRFLKRLYERVPPEDLEALPTQTLYGAAVALWRLAEQRRPGTARVRVYNPDVAEHGWSSPHTVIEIVNDDMPFLVDSVAAELERRGLTIHLIIHPVVVVRRDGSGRRIALLEGRPAGEGIAESLMHVQVDALSQQAALDDLREGILKVLGDVRVAIADWQPMLAKLNESVARLEAVPPPVPAEEVEEVKAFLRWLADNHFTFLGYREHAFTAGEPPLSSAVVGSELGILRDAHAALFTGAETPDELRAEARYFIESPEPIVVAKTTARAPVHRPVPMDYLGIKHYDRQGRVVGEARFVGLFTSAAYNRTPRDIPYLRRKIARALSSTGFDPLGHDGKALVNVLETYPRDELFQIAEDELFNTAMGILRLQERPRIRLFVRADRYERFCSCLVFIPREQYTGALRHRVEGLLATAFCGRVAAFYTQLGDSSLARLHLIIATTPGAVPRPDLARLEQQIVAAARSWDEDLHEALIERWGEETGNRMRVRYDGAFPSAYRERFSGCEAVRDIELCEIVAAPGEIAVAMYRPLEAAEHSARFKIYHARDPIALSDCLPMLENMGLRVIEEVPFRIARNGNQLPLYVQDFLLNEAHGRAFDPGPIRREFEETFGRVWRGEIENDGFNRLVAWARLTWREVVILRAYCKYLLQTKIPFSQAYMEETLARHPGIARLLIALYHARFDPARVGEGGRAATAAGTAIEEALEQVQSADEDRMLRRFLEIVRATTRTNYYQTGRDGRPKPYLSFKLDPHALTELPPPRPFAEIFVYSPRVEGVHLRGGKVARGGIRWSDRREDFRTEVLGLMKAQMVKNAVIVPVGAKGGFVPKRLPTGGDREATLAEVVACYGTLIRGLLDLTDNLTGATVIKPVQTVCHDDDDPYLVVAADKGTATFSDIANTIAKEYRHWLGDAFASGGSHGYDHKKMAITALGVWEGVKRHFRELGVNAETAVITAVGIGDMAGDVFGNGLLLSPHLKLVAAFNHMHIFCDPNPDPARSFAERRRLFELPRSTWAQYDENVLSPGGRVFNRASKSLDLTSEIKASLGLDRDRMAPAELILAILMAPVDLLWVGGIGTYVKAAQESNAEVDDRANDALRINGKELRCRVVGEGGNLGFTQRGRIEYAAAGGRLNTDAI
ncbi:MAG: NAD-glutamate dehydrogenase, partial [Alphaproteobacteria bacterium]|nr:NAD-glutamate dehydrogenase [Alphaproteobacteria bacterium]